MAETPYANEVQIVRNAIEQLRHEQDPSPIPEMEEEWKAASTGLEFNGITSSVFKHFLATRTLSPETRSALHAGVRAIRVIFGSEEPRS